MALQDYLKARCGGPSMSISPRFTICTIDGDLEVSRDPGKGWRVHFPGGERDDLVIGEQAVAVLTDPYVRAAVEAILEFETRKWTDTGSRPNGVSD